MYQIILHSLRCCSSAIQRHVITITSKAYTFYTGTWWRLRSRGRADRGTVAASPGGARLNRPVLETRGDGNVQCDFGCTASPAGRNAHDWVPGREIRERPPCLWYPLDTQPARVGSRSSSIHASRIGRDTFLFLCFLFNKLILFVFSYTILSTIIMSLFSFSYFGSGVMLCRSERRPHRRPMLGPEVQLLAQGGYIYIYIYVNVCMYVSMNACM